MFSSRSGLRGIAPSVTPLSSVFCDKVNRRHPLGNLLAAFSTLGGVLLVLAVSL